MAKLSSAMRRSLKPSQFALPEKKALPVNDESHAVAAKAPDIKQSAGKRMMKGGK